ncbi:Fe-only nitrogenase accessory protein AnfO [Xanthobacter sediminis]
MKIAVYVDDGGMFAGLGAPGRLRMLDNASGTWRETSNMDFGVSPGASLAHIKTTLRDTVTRMGECCTFVCAENRGLVFSLLQEEYGFRVWKAQGEASADRLDDIARQDALLAIAREKEAQERAFAALFSAPSGGCSAGEGGGRRIRRSPEAMAALRSLTEPLGEGRLRIDLPAILTRFSNANSWDVLAPILEDRSFTSLEIVCDHLPRWFTRKLDDLDLAADVAPHGGGVRAVVSPILPRMSSHE